MKEKIIVFAPHPGDEVWGCGGTIAKRLSEGYEVLVIVMTDGRYAFLKVLGIDSEPTPSELKEIRKGESKRAARILGMKGENLLFLDFEDGMLKKNGAEAREKVIEILSKSSPVEVYFTYEKDSHTDHRATNRIVGNSIRKLGLRTMKCQYSIARNYARIGPLKDTLFNLLRHDIIRVDISKFLPLKEVAIREIKSEITIISSRQERPLTERYDKFLKDEEIFFIDK